MVSHQGFHQTERFFFFPGQVLTCLSSSVVQLLHINLSEHEHSNFNNVGNVGTIFKGDNSCSSFPGKNLEVVFFYLKLFK